MACGQMAGCLRAGLGTVQPWKGRVAAPFGTDGRVGDVGELLAALASRELSGWAAGAVLRWAGARCKGFGFGSAGTERADHMQPSVLES